MVMTASTFHLAGLMKLQEIIRSPPNRNVEIYIRQGTPNTYRDILKEVKHKDIYSIIVDTVPENMHLFLRCVRFISSVSNANFGWICELCEIYEHSEDIFISWKLVNLLRISESELLATFSFIFTAQTIFFCSYSSYKWTTIATIISLQPL